MNFAKYAYSCLATEVYASCANFMQEKEKAEEEYRRNREEYWKFLESCDFIEVCYDSLLMCTYFPILRHVILVYENILFGFLGKQPMEKSSGPLGG